MERDFDTVRRRLLDDFQKDFPLDPRPFRVIGERLGISEEEVLDLLCELQEAGVVDRIGAVIEPGRVGASTLAAMKVPPQRLGEVAAVVSAFPEVNHNYEREHELNLWFVVAAATPARLRAVLDAIAARTGIPVVELPLVEAFRLDLGFPLGWSRDGAGSA